MIRINVDMLIEQSDNRKPLIEAATELVEYSLHDAGCISYDVYTSLTNDDHLAIIETWKDAESLKAHQESDHYKRLVPRLQKLSTMTSEKFTF